MNRRVLACLFLASLFSIGDVSAGVPRQINYQGFITEKSMPVTGERKIKFNIWDSAGGGNLLWASPEQSVPVKMGNFSTRFDLPESVDWGSIRPYLEIVVAGVALSPREPLTSVPYALQANKADSAETATIAFKAGKADTAIQADKAAKADVAAKSDVADRAVKADIADSVVANAITADKIGLPGTSAMISSWQKPGSPEFIDSNKISGSVPPGPHGGVHRVGASDPVQLVPSQIDGAAIVSVSSAGQVLQPSNPVVPLAIKGNAGATNVNVLEIYDAGSVPARQAYFDGTGNLTLNKNVTVAGVVSGNGSGLTNVPAGSITGTMPVEKIALTGTNALLSSWQKPGAPEFIDGNKIQGSVLPAVHAATHKTGGSDAIQIAPSQIEGAIPLNKIALDGTAALLSSWQKTGSPEYIDGAKVQGAIAPATHAATHRTAGTDVISLTPSQVDGTAIVAGSNGSQTIQPLASVVPLIIKGNAGATGVKVLSIYDGVNPPSEQAYFDGQGNLTLNKNISVGGNANITGNTAVTGNVTASGNMTVAGVISANGSGLTNLSASNINSGTIPQAQLPTTVVNYLVPSGAVMMFLTQACPSGWSEVTALRNRFPIGADTGNVDDNVPNNVSVTGGAAFHDHGISHTHSGTTGDSEAFDTRQFTTYNEINVNMERHSNRMVFAYGNTCCGGDDARHTHGFTTNSQSNATTSNANNYSPFLTVLFCQKQ